MLYSLSRFSFMNLMQGHQCQKEWGFFFCLLELLLTENIWLLTLANKILETVI